MLTLKHFHHHFLQDEDGAVSVDWVVLSAALVGLGISAYAGARSGVLSVSGKAGTVLSNAEITADLSAK